MDEYLNSLGLSPQELNKVMYHRSNMAKPGLDPEGNPITIYATGIQIPSGKYKGQFVSIPGYVGGKVIEDEGALWTGVLQRPVRSAGLKILTENNNG